ncbi:MAG: hypothetical protein HUJ26_04845 [Planctomycetaceae bacterium]|nr:hypothetical protein [Planctomycetaceae bacterium]
MNELELPVLQTLWVTQLVQVTFLAAVVWLIVKLFARRRPHLAYALWLLVLVKCLIPPIPISPVSIFPDVKIDELPYVARLVSRQEETLSPRPTLHAITPPPAPTARRAQDAANDDVPEDRISELSRGYPIEEPELWSSQDETPTGSPEPDTPETNTAEATVDQATLPVLALEQNHSNEPEVSARRATLEPWWTGWLVVCGGFLLATLLRVAFTLRRVKRRRVETSVELTEVVERLSKQFRLRRTVRVCVTAAKVGPAVVGFLRPLLILPEVVIRERSTAELEPIVAHELLHIKRGDLRVGWLQVLAQSLWWFHPLVWGVNRSLRREAERCCDEAVLAELNCTPAFYARCLLDVLEQKRNLTPIPVCPGVKPVEITKQRMERIMQLGQGCRKRTPWWCWLIVIGLGLVVLPGQGESETERNRATVLFQLDEAQATPVTTEIEKEGIGAAIDGSSPELSTRKYDIEGVLQRMHEDHGLSDQVAQNYVDLLINNSLSSLEYNRQSQSIPSALTKCIVSENSLIVRGTHDGHELVERLLKLWEEVGLYQVKVEIRLASTDVRISAENVIGKQEATSALTSTLTDLDVYRLINTIQSDARTNLFTAPKLTLFNGQQALVCDEFQRPFVTGMDGDQSVVDVLPEGWKLTLTPTVNAEGEIELDYQLRLAEILDVETRQLPGRQETAPATVQIPDARQTHIRSRATLQDGETLLISGLRRLSPNRETNDAENLVVMIRMEIEKVQLNGFDAANLSERRQRSGVEPQPTASNDRESLEDDSRIQLGVTSVDPAVRNILDQWEQASRHCKCLSGDLRVFFYSMDMELEQRVNGGVYYVSPDKFRIDLERIEIPAGEKSHKLSAQGKPFTLMSAPSTIKIRNGNMIACGRDDDEKEYWQMSLPETISAGTFAEMMTSLRGLGLMGEFINGLTVQEAVERYQFKLLPQTTEGVIWLEISPKKATEKEQVQSSQYILDRKSFLPIAIKIIYSEGKNECVQKFDNLKINGNIDTSLFDISQALKEYQLVYPNRAVREEPSNTSNDAPTPNVLRLSATTQSNSVSLQFQGPPRSHLRIHVPDRLSMQHQLLVPGSKHLETGKEYLLTLDHIPGKAINSDWPVPFTHDPQFHWSLEILPRSERTRRDLGRNPIPLAITDEDLDQVAANNPVTKVVYLRAQRSESGISIAVETLVSTRLDPGVDPIIAARRRGTVLAVLRSQRSLTASQEDKTTLEEALQFHAELMKCELVLDEAELKQAGVHRHAPVGDIKTDYNLPRKSLALIMEKFGLTYVTHRVSAKGETPVREELRVRARTRDVASQTGSQPEPLPPNEAKLDQPTKKDSLVARVYPVADLVVPIPGVDASNTPPPAVSGPAPGVLPVPNPDAPVTGTPIGLPGSPHRPLESSPKPVTYSSPEAGDLALRAQQPTHLPMKKSTSTPKCDASALIELLTETIKDAHAHKLPEETSMLFMQEKLSLVIRATEEDHAIIAELLTDLRRKQNLQVVIDCKVLQISAEALEKIQFDSLTFETAENKNEFLNRVQGQKEAQILASPKLTVFNGVGAEILISRAVEDERQLEKLHYLIVPTVSEDRRSVNVKFAINPTSSLDVLSKVKTMKIADGQSVLLEVTDELLPLLKQTGVTEVDKALRELKKKELGERTFVLLTPKVIIQEEEEELLGIE